ncbi:MAG: UbiA family prenyltransferase [Acidobacteriota bacterium]
MTSQELTASWAPKGQVYLRLGRVSNLPTVWSNCLAGIVLAGGQPEIVALLALLVSLSCFYVGGMFLNDAFDRGFDAVYRPERPLPAGEARLGEVYAVGFGLLLAGEALLALPWLARGEPPDLKLLLCGLILGALIVYYNYHHKNNPLAPVLMALCRAMIYVTAAAATSAQFSAETIVGAAALTSYVTGLTCVARQENLRDVRNLWPVILLFLPVAVPFWMASGRVAAEGLMLPLFLVWLVRALLFLARRTGRSVPRAVVSLIAGISLLDGLLIAGFPGRRLWVAACLAGFGLTLLLQRRIAGT